MRHPKLWIFPLFVLTVFAFANGCSHVPGARVPAGTRVVAGAGPDEFDPRFEKPWGGSVAKEHESLQALGTTIADFVSKEAAQNQQWHDELQQLKSRDPSDLSPDEQKKMKAIELILNDLPDRGGLATRDVHRRPQACANATLTMRADLPPEDRKGLFQPGVRYDAIVRFSNGNPRNLPDFAPDARGMAVKILKQGSLHDGATATELNDEGLLDLLGINFPVFFMNDPDHYVSVNQAFLAVSSDPVATLDPKSLYFKLREGASIYFSGLSQWERALALEVNGSIINNPLHEKYWSMMAYRLGDAQDPKRTAIKYMWVPCSGNLPEGGDPGWATQHNYSKIRLPWQSNPYDAIPEDVQTTLSSQDNRYYLRKNLYAELQTPKCFHLQIQHYLDDNSTPVEDVTHIWLENDDQRTLWSDKFAQEGGSSHTAKDRKNEVMGWEIASPVTIAELEIQPVSEADAKSVASGITSNSAVCEDLSFNPWNNVPSAHKPLGIVGRMRKAAYHGSRQTRHEINGVQDGSLDDHHATE